MYDRTMQGAIVGYGFIASQGHAPGYAEHNRHHVRVDIVAVADICEARRREAQRAFPMAVVYEDLDGISKSCSGWQLMRVE